LHVIVISDDQALAQHVRLRFDGAARLTILPAGRRRLPKVHVHEGGLLILVDTLHASATSIAKFIRLAQNGTAPCLVIGTTPQLMRSCDRLRTVLLDGKPAAGAPDAASHQAPLELSLSDFMERKFHDFVRKIRHSGGRQLMKLLRNEFEKPLIALTLKETKGNQVQAAELLGMNRNTLRKKITELKIAVKR
jgi:two-component system nitrogen regulation response regulator GlnG